MILRGLNLGIYLRYVRLWLFVAILPAIIAGAFAYQQTKKEHPIYTASGVLYVQQPAAASNGPVADIGTSVQLAQTYSQMITQPRVAVAADRILNRTYYGYHVEKHDLRSTLSNVQLQTPLISLSVTDTNPQRAALAVNVVGRVFIAQIKQLNDSRFASDLSNLNAQLNNTQTQINQLTTQIANTPVGTDTSALQSSLTTYQSAKQQLLTSIQNLKLTADETSSSVSMYTRATPPTSPTGPHPLSTAALWAFLALAAGTALLYGYEYVNDLPSSPDEIGELVGAPVLGAISRFGGLRRRASLISGASPNSPMAEEYRLVRTNLQFTGIDSPARAIVVTSPLPRDGKTTTASNLAEVFAQGGMAVTLVDADLRRPSMHRIFGVPMDEGLTNLLVADHLNGHKPHPVDQVNLSVLASGPLPPNPSDLLGTMRMREIVTQLRTDADMVLLDSPPVLAASDATILATMSDGVVLVVDPRRTRRRDIRATREAIEAVGGRILGVVINRLSGRTKLYYHYAYYPSSYRPPKSLAPRNKESGTGTPAGR
ncbi:MAG TPA: polysaccharide biosynthesis tyrosine autokinase [Chloroflexota bacterium]|nr:polysaccharide biosynthesis tyrosine autokinase [Chloroflexota bacterium]